MADDGAPAPPAQTGRKAAKTPPVYHERQSWMHCAKVLVLLLLSHEPGDTVACGFLGDVGEIRVA